MKRIFSLLLSFLTIPVLVFAAKIDVPQTTGNYVTSNLGTPYMESNFHYSGTSLELSEKLYKILVGKKDVEHTLPTGNYPADTFVGKGLVVTIFNEMNEKNEPQKTGHFSFIFNDRDSDLTSKRFFSKTDGNFFSVIQRGTETLTAIFEAHKGPEVSRVNGVMSIKLDTIPQPFKDVISCSRLSPEQDSLGDCGFYLVKK